MTGNLVGVSGNVLYKFEALVGGIVLVFNAFKLTPDFSMPSVRGSVAEARAACRGFSRAPLAPGLHGAAQPSPFSALLLK